MSWAGNGRPRETIVTAGMKSFALEFVEGRDARGAKGEGERMPSAVQDSAEGCSG